MSLDILKLVEELRRETINFLTELITIPSISGEEEAVAGLIESKMYELEYDSVEVDEAGNVIGTIEGRNDFCLLYNGHMDTVPPGEMEDPFSAKILDGVRFGEKGKVLFGRGACDMKGALASMIMAGAALKQAEIEFPGKLVITCSVMEEKAESFGSKHLIAVDKLKPDVVVVGEATNLDITIGHRGLIYSEIITKGKSCHASAPERGINALYQMTKVIEEIQKLASDLPEHPFLGKTTMSINTISLVPGVKNVVPERCSVSVDVRNTPEFNIKKVEEVIEEVIDDLKKRYDKFDAETRLMEVVEESYTGFKNKVTQVLPPLYTNPNDPYVEAAKSVVTEVLGKEPKIRSWVFATDSACFSEAGASTFGFGPGNERFAHTSQDHVKIEDVIAATKVYALLPMKLWDIPGNQ